MKLLLTFILISVPALAHEFKSKDFCSSTTKDICAHIGHDEKPDRNGAQGHSQAVRVAHRGGELPPQLCAARAPLR